MKPLVYLASPYTDDDPEVMEHRFNAVTKYAATLMRRGIFVFSPISHTHPIAKYGLPLGWEYWKELDTTMLSKCDSMIVLMLPGYSESKGVTAEIKIMKAYGKKIEWHAVDGTCFQVFPGHVVV